MLKQQGRIQASTSSPGIERIGTQLLSVGSRRMSELYALIPVGVSIIGGIYAIRRPPGPKLRSAVQHIAAGVVFAAAAAELLPDAVRRGTIWPVVLGALVGISAMLGLRAFEKVSKGPTGLIGASAVDALIDGMVLGLGFAAGQKQGLLLAIALAVEFLFLAVSIASDFERNTSSTFVLSATIGVSLMVPIGSLAAGPISRTSSFIQTAAYGFGLIALLYLVTEELLVEAHRAEDAAWITALFVVGFIALIVVNEAIG